MTISAQYRKIAQAGIDHLVAYFAKAPKYTFTTLFDEKPAVTYSNGTSVLVRDLDVGLNGILDKVQPVLLRGITSS